MAKRLLGLSKFMLDLDGKPIMQRDDMGMLLLNGSKEPQPTVAKDVLSAILARGTTEDPIHTIEIALKVRASKGQIVLDDSDIVLLQSAVKTDRQSTDLAKAFLLTLLNDASPLEEVVPPEDDSAKPKSPAREKSRK